jgi:hypothetical protein
MSQAGRSDARATYFGGGGRLVGSSGASSNPLNRSKLMMFGVDALLWRLHSFRVVIQESMYYPPPSGIARCIPGA